MKVHKDSSTSAAPKRKPEDNNDDLRSGLVGKAEQGHRAKKIKPTCGYIPGSGNPYKGTMRDSPSAPVGRALGNRPTNTMLKHRESIAKQDKKNLNCNALKSKMPCGVSDSSLSYGTWSDSVNEEGKKPANYLSTKPELAKSGGAQSHGRGRPRPSIEEKGGRQFR